MFDDPEENQEETMLSPRLRFALRLARGGMSPNNDQELSGDTSGGMSVGMKPGVPAMDGARSWSALQRQPQIAPKPTIGQRMMGIGVDAASGQRANATSGIAPKLTIGQRMMGIGRRGSGIPPIQGRRGIFTNVIPTRATPVSPALSGRPWLGEGQKAFARSQQTAPTSGPGRSNAVADMTAQVRTRSRIPPPAAAPDVEPDPNLEISDSTQQTTVLGGLMRDIGGSETAPIGVSPGGSLMRDVTSSTRTPSRILSQHERISPQRTGILPQPANSDFIFGDKVSPEFLAKVQRISSKVGIDPNWLMAVMDFETAGTLSPAKKNAAGSSGTGLLQFTKKSGYDPQELAKMTAEQQLDYVAKYLQPYKGRLRNLPELYLSVLWPAAIGKPDDYVLFRSPSVPYKQNGRAFDLTGKGYVTKGDVAAVIKKRYKAGFGRGSTKLMPDGSSLSRVGKKAFVQLPKRPSLIKRHAPGPEVEPDLSVNDPEQLRTALNGLMRGTANSDKKGE